MLRMWATIALWIAAVIVLAPVAVFCAECLLGALRGLRRHSLDGEQRPAVAVLIPAHDEEARIAATIATIMPQLAGGDRILVVADNCTDGTAAAARAAGAEVVERQDSERRGKGFALANGVAFLAERPPEVLVVVDADCDVAGGTVEALARAVRRFGRPVQCLDVLLPPPEARMRDQLSAFAFTVKNVARPAGLAALGLPCMLMGTGMALPWHLAGTSLLGSGNIVEDMQLGIDLAISGTPALFSPGGRVSGHLPRGEAALTQRRRWEHGHLHTLLTQVPRLLAQATAQRRLGLLAMAADLAIPPLSLLVGLWAALTAIAGAAFCLGLPGGPLVALAAGGAALLVSVIAAWARFARHLLPLKSLAAVPFYVLWKLPMYVTYPFRRERRWVRTAREA